MKSTNTNAFKVPFQDFKAPYHELKAELDEAYQRFMESGWYVLGQEVKAFESEYADYCESNYCVGVGHGLDALRLALIACEIGPGDEVIVPSNTYIATWLAVTQVGAIVVPVEPDPATYNLDPNLIPAALTKRTRAILPVNLYGQPCNYDPIVDIARDQGLKVLIDNAQAQGSRYKGRRVGGIADVECHSFYPSKNLGAFGEAGAITTNDDAIADRVRVLRNYGSRVRYQNETIGFNSRLDELQAAFLRIKLRKLDQWNRRRSNVANAFDAGLEPNLEIQIPAVEDWAEHVWHLYVVQHEKRNDLQAYLQESGIQTLIHYPTPPHLSEAYADLGWSIGSFPIAEQIANQILSLPIGPFMENEAVDHVCTAITAFHQR